MPTIVFVSPKGGAGKTTSALVLTTEIARGADVTLIDADPNRPAKAWATRKGDAARTLPARMTVVSDVNEDNITERIEEAAAKTPFVIVDLEGTASKIVVLAVSCADFVIVPTQGSHLDAEQAGRAFRVIQQQEKTMRRHVADYVLPYSVLLTRTNPVIRTRTLSHIVKGLKSAGIPVFDTELNEREAFRAMFSFKETLDHLDPEQVANLDKARENAAAFTQEVIDRLNQVGGKNATS